MVGKTGTPLMTRTAKSDVLARIRQALDARRGERASDYQAIGRAYRQRGELTPPARLALFITRLEDYGVTVYRCRSEALQLTVKAALDARGKSGLIVPTSLPSGWLPGDREFVPDLDLSYAAL